MRDGALSTIRLASLRKKRSNVYEYCKTDVSFDKKIPVKFRIRTPDQEFGPRCVLPWRRFKLSECMFLSENVVSSFCSTVPTTNAFLYLHFSYPGGGGAGGYRLDVDPPSKGFS